MKGSGPVTQNSFFLSLWISNLSWLSYGFLKGDWTLIVVNTVGAMLQSLYILVYFFFSAEKVGGLVPKIKTLPHIFPSTLGK